MSLKISLLVLSTCLCLAIASRHGYIELYTTSNLRGDFETLTTLGEKRISRHIRSLKVVGENCCHWKMSGINQKTSQ